MCGNSHNCIIRIQFLLHCLRNPAVLDAPLSKLQLSSGGIYQSHLSIRIGECLKYGALRTFQLAYVGEREGHTEIQLSAKIIGMWKQAWFGLSSSFLLSSFFRPPSSLLHPLTISSPLCVDGLYDIPRCTLLRLSQIKVSWRNSAHSILWQY